MTLLEQYIDCMCRGDECALADLFAKDSVLHDSSWTMVVSGENFGVDLHVLVQLRSDHRGYNVNDETFHK